MAAGAERGIGFWLCETVAFCLILAGIDLYWLEHRPIAEAVRPFTGGVAVAIVGFYLPSLGDRTRNFIQQRRRPAGRMGLLNARVDVPKAITAQKQRLHAITVLVGRLGSTMQAAIAGPIPQTETQQIALARKIAGEINPVGRKLRREADAFLAETTRFSTGLDRWLEIAERDQTNDGYAEQQQVPELVKWLSSGADILPTLREKRQMFEKFRGASDTMDASCGEVVAAFDVLIVATEQIVATSERSLRRIKAILERFVAKSQTEAAAAGRTNVALSWIDIEVRFKELRERMVRDTPHGYGPIGASQLPNRETRRPQWALHGATAKLRDDAERLCGLAGRRLLGTSWFTATNQTDEAAKDTDVWMWFLVEIGEIKPYDTVTLTSGTEQIPRHFYSLDDLTGASIAACVECIRRDS